MLLLEPFHERKPGNGVTQRTDWQLYQNLFAGEVKIVRKNRFPQFAFPVDFQTETDVKLLHRFDRTSRFHVHGIQETVRVQILENAAVFALVREFYPKPVVEIKADAFHRFQCRRFRRQTKGRLFRRPGLNRERRIRHRFAFNTEIRHIRYILLFRL
ncbi:hypothetical protein SDC9_123752 [bioreactor metagenome]|uniref:Uncharacterized protein n=1 Tax=bioreactor metagenome TaxID=1076179 RepID=A0A645CIL5_9ZZZZ